MSKNSKSSLRLDNGIIEVKSKFDAEFRRFAWDRTKGSLFETFCITVCKLHHLEIIPFVITYTDVHGDLLPINNDDNFHHALDMTKTILRIIIQKKGESSGEINGYGTLNVKKRNPISKLISNDLPHKPRINISLPEDFRRVSAIIDVDIVPETHRRVKLMKNGSDKPLGFYIRDGTSVRVTPQGLEKVPGIFISRLVPGGLAESTGLLAVNDEVLEVNGIEVAGKTLDQVTDMMVANSANLIITVKPVNQRLTLAPLRGAVGRYSQISQASSASGHSRQSSKSYDSDIIVNEQDEEDEIQDHLNKSNKSSRSDGGTSKSDKVSSGSEKSNKSDEGKNSHTPDKNTKTKESPSDNNVPVTEGPGMTV